VRGWLTPTPDPEFESKCAEVCALDHEAPAAAQQDVRTVLVDEMTGVQALARAAPDLPVQPGKVARREFESVRHGMQTGIAAFEVATGRVTAGVGENRTAQDYANFLDTLFASGAPTPKGRVIVDNLNPPVSQSVVGLVARLGKIEDDLGETGKPGGLASKATGEAFLRNQSHRITFHFTPKQASWLLAQPDRDLVLHPRAPTPAPRQLHFQRTPDGSHRSLHRRFQSHPRQAVQVDHARRSRPRSTAR